VALKLEDLAAQGLLAPERVEQLSEVAARFSVAVTNQMADLIDPADPADPVAAQFIPDESELETAPDDRPDPIGDEHWSPLPGLVHRYPDRVLLKPVLVCPLYCRFCFRREHVGKDGMLSPRDLNRAFAYIEDHPEIWEVIVTGGDPFVLSPRRLGNLVRRLEAIGHVAVIRFHTRVPVAEPSRVSPALVAALSTGKALYIAIHANHPREVTPQMREAVARLTRAGIPVLSQSVLLRGVNDDPAILEQLFRSLVAIRVKPYYLHHPDLAPGTGHFRLPLDDGRRLVKSLRGRVSGLCQPAYVLDIPGGYGKVPIGESAASRCEQQDCWMIEDSAGGTHPYPPIPGNSGG